MSEAIMQALRNADASGDNEDAARLAQMLEAEGSRPPREEALPGVVDGGSVAQDATPGAPTDLREDEFRAIPVKISGVTLDAQTRQMILTARDIEDPKEKRMETARIAGRIAALGGDNEGKSLADNILSGKSGAGLRGFANGLFGAGDIAAAGGSYINDVFDMEDSELTFGDHLEAQREFRRVLNEQNPVIGIGSEIVGAVAGGGALLKGAQKLGAKVGGRAGALLEGSATFNKGEKLKNVGKAALQGAVVGAPTRAAMEGEAGTGAAIGAVAGPVGLGVARAAVATGGAIKKLFSGPAGNSLRVLGKKLNLSDKELGTRWLNFQAIQGKPPTISDLANDSAAKELGVIFSGGGGAARPAVTEVARREAARHTAKRVGEFADNVEGGRVTSTQTAQEARRTTRAVEQFKTADADEIVLTKDQVNTLLGGVDAKDIIKGNLRRRVDDILDSIPEGEGGVITGADANALRKSFGRIAKGNGDNAQVAKELELAINEVASEQSPAFREALAEFGSRSERGKGIAAGVAAVRGKTSQVRAGVDAAEEGTRRNAASNLAGQRVGARTELVDQAGESVSKNIGLARELAEDGGLNARLRELLPSRQVDELQELSRIHSQGASNVNAITPPVGITKDGTAELLRDGVNIMVAASGKAGAGFQAGSAMAVIRRLLPGGSDKVVKQMAKDIFDPSKTKAIIAAMERAGKAPHEILEAFASALAITSQ